ncbi:unnamed protein product [Ostreobium quekettii]|uniref:Cullin N-terminal domain-containing protein n=1 Tax=Ostreobium quekettii TaxID=121088 RepID=A0A8S1J1X4_9CHLO|nr:unnamed protein product [Ostreobium quekettii]|eukprot:evm.model.scf_123.1 EVM.evm.TU.scf_123.1   scf_123:47104-52780(+)
MSSGAEGDRGAPEEGGRHVHSIEASGAQSDFEGFSAGGSPPGGAWLLADGEESGEEGGASARPSFASTEGEGECREGSPGPGCGASSIGNESFTDVLASILQDVAPLSDSSDAEGAELVDPSGGRPTTAADGSDGQENLSDWVAVDERAGSQQGDAEHEEPSRRAGCSTPDGDWWSAAPLSGSKGRAGSEAGSESDGGGWEAVPPCCGSDGDGCKGDFDAQSAGMDDQGRGRHSRTDDVDRLEAAGCASEDDVDADSESGDGAPEEPSWEVLERVFRWVWKPEHCQAGPEALRAAWPQAYAAAFDVAQGGMLASLIVTLFEQRLEGIGERMASRSGEALIACALGEWRDLFGSIHTLSDLLLHASRVSAPASPPLPEGVVGMEAPHGEDLAALVYQRCDDFWLEAVGRAGLARAMVGVIADLREGRPANEVLVVESTCMLDSMGLYEAVFEGALVHESVAHFRRRGRHWVSAVLRTESDAPFPEIQDILAREEARASGLYPKSARLVLHAASMEVRSAIQDRMEPAVGGLIDAQRHSDLAWLAAACADAPELGQRLRSIFQAHVENWAVEAAASSAGWLADPVGCLGALWERGAALVEGGFGRSPEYWAALCGAIANTFRARGVGRRAQQEFMAHVATSHPQCVGYFSGPRARGAEGEASLICTEVL